MKRVDPNDRGVEFWMSELERQMMLGVREAFWIGLDTYEKEPRTEWVKKQAGQIVLNASQVYWTKDVEAAMTDGGLEGLKKYYEFLKQ
jgi:dynein heavy chain